MNKTPRYRIKGVLRRLWLQSRERYERTKIDRYCCQKCGIKQSKKKGSEVKIEVDHKEGIDIWDEVCSIIEDKILCSNDLDKLQTLCVPCHREKTEKERNKIANN